jgi:hypothetical protein
VAKWRWPKPPQTLKGHPHLASPEVANHPHWRVAQPPPIWPHGGGEPLPFGDIGVAEPPSWAIGGGHPFGQMGVVGHPPNFFFYENWIWSIQLSYLQLLRSFIIIKFQFNTNKYLKSIIHCIYFQNNNNNNTLYLFLRNQQ